MRAFTLCFAVFHYPATHTATPAAYLDWAPLFRALPRALAEKGYTVHVVHLFPTTHTFTENDVHYHFVCSGTVSRGIARLIGGVTARKPTPYEPAFRAIRRIRALQPDLIHFHGTNLYLNHALMRMALGHRPSIVLHHHGGYPSPSPFVRRLQRFNFRKTARFLFTVPQHAAPFIEAGLIAEPKRVIAFMETSSPFRRHARVEARRLTGMAGDPVFLWTGRLVANKDPMTALQGFERILASWPAAHLYLHYLTDNLLPALQQYVAARPLLEPHVHFRGRTPFDRMEPIYNSADFFLQASHREFSGVAVLDALACGVLPVVTDIPSLRAMTADGAYGILFPPGDVDALVRGVLATSRREIPERSRQVRAWFDDTLSFPALARQLDALYREILDASSVTRQQPSVGHKPDNG